MTRPRPSSRSRAPSTPAVGASAASAEADDVSRRVLALGVKVGIVAIVAQTILHLIDAWLPGSRRLLDADDDVSAFSWLAVAAAAMAALAAFLVAALLRERARSFYALAALLAFLSLDDMVQIHEEIALAARIPGFDYSERIVWPIIYLPILGSTFFLLEAVARAAPERVRQLIRLGLGLFAAAVVLEVAAVAVLLEDETPLLKAVYILEVAAEEAAELGGWIAVATALTAVLASGLVRLGHRAGDAQRS